MDNIPNIEFNYETRLHFDKEFDKFSVNSFVGGNIRKEHYNSMVASTEGGLIVPLLYNLGNSKDKPTVENYLSNRQVNSIFGMLSIGYDDVLFVEATARNDWSSTLPAKNNSYFYPSVTGSLVFSEFIKGNWLRFGKLRAGWSRTGNDTSPYRLFNTFISNGNFIGSPTFNLTTVNKNNNLTAETVDSWEIGLEMSMFRGRVGLDLTYYDQRSYDLVMPVQLSASTGFRSTVENAAEMRNKGVEALLNITPVKLEDFTWNVTWNFAKNNNTVEKLMDGVDAVNLTSAPFKVSLWAVEGMKYGQIRGTDFVYDDAGNKVVASSGRYLASPITNLGSVIPDYNMGLRNTFNYRNFSLSFLIDMQKGGKYFSTSNMWGMNSGMFEETAANGIRENGIVLPGVTGKVTYKEDGSYTVTNTAENTKNISANKYGSNFYVGPMAQNVFDADYFKLRDLSLTYSFPDSFKGPFQKVDISVFGRNLLIWGLDNKNFDPEMASAGSGNIQGIEGGSLPSTRTYGMNLKLQF